MHVRKINSDNFRDKKKFVQFPFHLYKNCPLWVPPFVHDIELTLDHKKHPFYHHSDAAFFLAEDSNQIVGRVAVLDKKKYNQYHNEKCAFFYYLETINDIEVVRALFAAAQEWVSQRGLNRLLGPFGFVQGDSIGVLVEGFDKRPAMGQAYNFSYYDELLQKGGFSKKTDYYSGYLPGNYQLSQRFYDIAEKVKTRRGFWIKSFENKKELHSWISRIQKLYNSAFAHNFGYCPLSEEEADMVAHRLLAIANPRLIKLVMKDNDIVGFLFAYVDISDGIRKAKGKFWPCGFFHLNRDFKRSEWINFNGTGLLPGHRGVGANAVLYTEMANTVQQFNFRHADIVQVEENNIKSMGDMQAIGVKWYKKHRVYERLIVDF